MRRIALLFAIVCAALPPAQSQTFSFESDRVPMVELAGKFRFHTGDDPDGKLGWSAPSFHDSAWQLLRSDKDWFEQGYRNYGGTAWYRFTVTVPAQHPPLALYVPYIRDSFQIFANGRLIGENGPMPPHPKVVVGRRLVYPIPADVFSPGQPLVFAIRVWHWPQWAMYFGGGPTEALRLGDASLIQEWKTAGDEQVFWQRSVYGYLFLMELLAGLAGLALFALHRSDREYLWFGFYELLSAAGYSSSLYLNYHPYWLRIPEILNHTFELSAWIAFVQFIVIVTQQRRSRLRWIAILSLALNALVFVAGSLEWLSVSVWNALMGLAMLPFDVAVLALLTVGARRGIRDAQLLLFPIGLFFLEYNVGLAIWVAFSAGFTATGPLMDHVRQVTAWPFPAGSDQIANFLTQLAVLAILVLRFTRTRRDEVCLANELQAARAVQQVLVPEEIPALPGFAIQCVYKPAGEVGGDFFQIVPTRPGGVLAVIGDVSGKGMPAAMTVSLLVGTFRTLAHYTQSPGEILTSMNERMLGRNNGGFTTCLCVRVDADGSMTAANAGHLAPYLDGKELDLENGLPLGLAAESSYPETTRKLALGARLTMLTDGVIEAQSATGVLYGFDRTAAISTQPAESIAQAARQFGQEDDITVLTLTLRSPEAVHA